MKISLRYANGYVIPCRNIDDSLFHISLHISIEQVPISQTKTEAQTFGDTQDLAATGEEEEADVSSSEVKAVTDHRDRELHEGIDVVDKLVFQMDVLEKKLDTTIQAITCIASLLSDTQQAATNGNSPLEIDLPSGSNAAALLRHQTSALVNYEDIYADNVN
jgi:hypothetical protein